MPESQTIAKPSDTEEQNHVEESEQSSDAPEHLKPIPNHPLAAVIGSFHDSVFFEEVIENIKARREEERKRYMEDDK